MGGVTGNTDYISFEELRALGCPDGLLMQHLGWTHEQILDLGRKEYAGERNHRPANNRKALTMCDAKEDSRRRWLRPWILNTIK